MSSNNSGNQTFTRVVNSAAPLGDLYVDSVVADSVVADNQVIKQVMAYLPSGATAVGNYWLVTDGAASAQSSGSSPDASVLLLPPNSTILNVVLSTVGTTNITGLTSINMGTAQWALTVPTAGTTIANTVLTASINAGCSLGVPSAFAGAGAANCVQLDNTSSVGVVVGLVGAAITAGTFKVAISYIVG